MKKYMISTGDDSMGCGTMYMVELPDEIDKCKIEDQHGEYVVDIHGKEHKVLSYLTEEECKEMCLNIPINQDNIPAHLTRSLDTDTRDNLKENIVSHMVDCSCYDDPGEIAYEGCSFPGVNNMSDKDLVQEYFLACLCGDEDETDDLYEEAKLQITIEETLKS
jgi:hypothetical protein